MLDPSTPGSAIGSAAGRGNDARRALALAGETFAAQHLERLGYEIVARNHRTRFGELDIVACDAQALVFVEVKTRRASETSEPWRAMTERKRDQVRRMAAAYLAEVDDRPRGLDLRFDAIAVAIDARGRLVSIDHLEAAF
ncbi:MAG TPA: YraN family protein [Solirubrobacteraceae bacterium]